MRGSGLAGSSRKLDLAEKWLRDCLSLCRPPAFSQCLDVEMSQAKELIDAARKQGIHLTYTHVLLKATALALAANPDLHLMVCGGRVYCPNQVDIGLSVAGETFVAPILVLERAEAKSLPEIAEEIKRRTPEIQANDREMLQMLRRWGWLVPTGILRRGLVRLLFRFIKFRHRGSGTFQLSILPAVDQAIAPVFMTSAMLVAGRVRDRVVAVDGAPAVRPVVSLTCCADHRVWDGRAGERFLLAVRQVLETGGLDAKQKLLCFN